MGLIFRLFKKSDLVQAVDVFLSAFQSKEKNWTKSMVEKRLLSLVELNPDLCFVIELDKKVVGLLFLSKGVWVNGNYLELTEFAVLSDFRGQGIGSEALDFLNGFAKQNNFSAIYLTTDSRKQALRLYERKGFKKTNYVVMEKEFN